MMTPEEINKIKAGLHVLPDSFWDFKYKQNAIPQTYFIAPSLVNYTIFLKDVV